MVVLGLQEQDKLPLMQLETWLLLMAMKSSLQSTFLEIAQGYPLIQVAEL
jgi:hypothetical protein